MSGRKKIDPVKEIMGRDFQKRSQILKAIIELKGIGSFSAGNGIIRLFQDTGVNVSCDPPVYNDRLVKNAIYSLEEMEDGAWWLSKFAEIEKYKHRERWVPDVSGETTEPEFDTHEDEIIAAILRIGGDEAVEALIGTVGTCYPEKAAAALKQIDASNTVAGIIKTAKVDFEKGVQPRNIQGLYDLVDLHKQSLNNISPDSIREAVEALGVALLDREKLLNCLEGGYCSSEEWGLEVPYDAKPMSDEAIEAINALRKVFAKVDHVVPYDAKPLSDEEIGVLREVFVAVDEAEITSKEYTSDFDKIVDHHEYVMGNGNALEEEYAHLSPAA